MRPVFVAAFLGAALTVNVVSAQDGESQAPKKKHTPTAMDSLFENGPARPHALEDSKREAAARKAEQDKAPDAAPAKPAPTEAAPMVPTVQAAPAGPPQKNLTGEEFRLIHVGSSQKEVLTVLGPASSRVVVPDDDGHLRETLEYWVKGNPAATVRLDNGRVVEIETKRK
jgi:hypothetical protein